MGQINRILESILTESTRYEQIVYLSNSQDFDDFKGGIEGFFNASDKAMAKYLSQWDSGDGGEEYDTEPWGRSDTVEDVKVSGAGEYVLAYNSSLGYASLYKER